MFTFTGTTVINSGVDLASGLVKFDHTSDTFKVKRVGNFVAANVTAAYKRIGYEGVASTATFTPPTAPSQSGAEDFYRIELFMRLSGNQTSTMASAATVYKSKPIHIEFKVAHGDSESTVADNMVKAIKFFQQNLYPYIKAEKELSDAVVISGVDEYEVFNKAELQKLTSATVSVYPDDQNVYTKVSDAKIANGKEGFGTYMNIMKNLRLPTMENMRFITPNDEMPIMDAVYDQYTIEYCKDRGILGTDAVGDKVTSITQHVFFVKRELSASFASEMASAGITVTDISKGIPVATLEVVKGQSVKKNSSAVLKFKLNGIERNVGGEWSATGGTTTGITFSGNTIKTTSSSNGSVTVQVKYADKTASGSVTVEE